MAETIPHEEQKIKTFGQITEIIRVEKMKDGYRCYVDPSIVVPSFIYQRDYIHSSEIQEFL
jgi:hypothetical protein